MKIRAISERPHIIGSLHATALACLGLVVVPAHADPTSTSALTLSATAGTIPLEPSPLEEPARFNSTISNGVSSTADASNRALPRGNEMSAIAGVELERTDRRFRSRVVDWAMDRSVVAGFATDFLLHGSDRGVHLRMPSSSEYVVRWETRF